MTVTGIEMAQKIQKSLDTVNDQSWSEWPKIWLPKIVYFRQYHAITVGNMGSLPTDTVLKGKNIKVTSPIEVMVLLSDCIIRFSSAATRWND